MPKMKKYTQAGFTLVELVTVIILLGVVGTLSSRFIADNVVLYQSSVNQNERLNDARFVINRMSKELDSAIAFSVTRVPTIAANTCIQFVPFTAAGQYLGSVTDKPIKLIMDKETRDLVDPNKNSFAGQYLSILTTDSGEFDSLPSDTIAEIDSYIPVSGANPTQASVVITAGSELLKNSAASRYFIARNKVQYCLASDGKTMNLMRSEVSLDRSFTDWVLMAENLSIGSSMSLTNASQFSNAILELNFNFLLRDNSEIKFEHQVVMSNVP